jgi:hypothetical protein
MAARMIGFLNCLAPYPMHYLFIPTYRAKRLEVARLGRIGRKALGLKSRIGQK